MRLTALAAITFLAGLLSADAAGGAEPQLGPWHCIGPFKESPIGLHLRAFDHVFPVEKDVLAAGAQAIDFTATYRAEHFLDDPEATRQWTSHPEWTDGYMHYLPHGPAPMRNETVYLTRTITAEKPEKVQIRIYALDNIRVWLNGALVNKAHNSWRRGPSRYAAAFVRHVRLTPGENRLLVKITSMHSKHGFAFAMPPYTLSSDHVPGQNYESSPPSTNAVDRVQAFRFDVTPIPMYDPPVLSMAEQLEKLPKSEAAATYTRKLGELKQKVSDIDDSELAVQAIDAFWDEQRNALPPIAFIESLPFEVNAIAPVESRGGEQASIKVFDPANPAAGARVIFHDPQMQIFDMNVSYDAKTIFFSAFTRTEPGGMHLYEIGVDGTGLKQITRGNHTNISPLLLPNGELMFVSDRAGSDTQCQPRPAGVLYVCNRDGSNVRRVSGNTLSDHTPQMMNDGRVMFTRWDYGVDKNVFARHNLWTINPDGTHFQLFGSNTKEDPNGFWKARAIPGRPEIVCVFGPHHSNQTGMLGLVWDRPVGSRKDLRGEGFRWITREMPTVGDHRHPWGYRDPYPLHEHLFLVSYGGDGERKNRLYLLDDRGNRHLLHQAQGKLVCFYPIPLAPRQPPPIIPTQCDNPEFVYRDPVEANRDPDETLKGTFVLQNVYEGIGKTVQPGEVKALQVIEQVPKSKYVPIGQDFQGYAPAIGRGTMYVRRLIGTVPVEADGSAHFVAPAIRDISFNALDDEGRVIRRMGSTLHVMPGERQSCIGCHETRGMTPPARTTMPLAAQRAPSVPTYPEWTRKGIIDFNTVVQPVLDKHCVSCHSGPTPAHALDLSSDKTRFFSMAYDSLLDHGVVDYINMSGTDHDEGYAKDRGAIISRIRTTIETDDQCGKPLSLEDRQRIYTWIDASVPYYGTYVVTRKDGIGGRDRWLKQGWFERDFAPVFQKRCVSCHQRTVHPQPYNYIKKPAVRVTSKLWTDAALSAFGFERYQWALYGPAHRINLTHPEWSQMLTAPLAKDQGGFGFCQNPDGTPVFRDKTDPDYVQMLKALKKGHEAIKANPRVDMPELLEFLRQADRQDSEETQARDDIRHDFLITDIRKHKVMKFADNNRLEWEYSINTPTDIHRLTNGNVLVAGIRSVVELTPEGKENWKYTNPGDLFSAVPLPNGNRLIGCSGQFRIIEIDPADHSIQREMSTKGVQNDGHMHSRHIRQCRNGDILVALCGESKVNRYSSDGVLLRSFDIRKLAESCGLQTTGKHQAYAVEELPNGNLLMCSGFPAMVVEVDPRGDVLWSLTAADVPDVNFMFAGGAKRLENGNTIICNWTGPGYKGDYIPVFEVNPEKDIVWSFRDKSLVSEPVSLHVF